MKAQKTHTLSIGVDDCLLGAQVLAKTLVFENFGNGLSDDRTCSVTGFESILRVADDLDVTDGKLC